MPAPEFFSWTFPGAPISIETQLGLVERLKREILHASGLETSGILLGRVMAACPRTVRVSGFRPVPRQAREFRQALADLRQKGRETPVGFYRSRRNGLGLDQADLAIIRKCFSSAADVFLMARPETDGQVTGGFFFWDRGEIQSDFSFLEFPLSAAELREKPAAAGAGSPRGRIWGALAAAVLVIAATLGLWLPRSSLRASPAAAPALGLKFESRGAEIRLTWNRFLPEVQAANRGTLSIHAGDRFGAVSLTPGQIQAGSFATEVPRSGVIRFRLELSDGAGRSVSEETMAIWARKPLVDPPSPTMAAARLSGGAAQQTVATEPERRAPRPFEPPPPTPAADESSLPEPPALAPIVQSSTAPRLSWAPPAAEAAPAPPPMPSRDVEYFPPKPLRMVKPAIPPNLATIVSHPIQVQVKLSIDEKGKVVAAEPLPSGSVTRDLLGKVAAGAARLWLFEPARVSSAAVPAKIVVNFDFEPAGRK